MVFGSWQKITVLVVNPRAGFCSLTPWLRLPCPISVLCSNVGGFSKVRGVGFVRRE